MNTELITKNTTNGNNKLMLACNSNLLHKRDSLDDTLEIIKMLMDTGINVNNQNNKGQTALMIAFKTALKSNSSIDIVKLLLENKANVNQVDIYGDTVLTLTCKKYRNKIELSMIQLLVKFGLDINIQNSKGNSALMILADKRNDDDQVISYLIENCSDVNIINNDKETILIRMCASDYIYEDNIIKLLIEKGANLDNQDVNGATAIMYAATYSSKYDFNTIRLLLENNASLEPVDILNRTFLIIFVKNMLINNYRYTENDLIDKIINRSSNVLRWTNDKNKTAYDYYVKKAINVLNEHQVAMLKGDIDPHSIKSANKK